MQSSTSYLVMGRIFLGLALLGAISVFGLNTAHAVVRAGPAAADARSTPVAAADGARIIVRFRKPLTDAGKKNPHESADLRARRLGDGLVADLRLSGALKLDFQRHLGAGADLFRVHAASPLALRQLLESIRELPGVQYAMVDRIVKPMFVPNDPRFAEQWDLYEKEGGIRMPAAWEIATGAGATVAVIDTGYRPHADLVDNILPGYDFIHDANISGDGDRRDADARDKGDWQIIQGTLVPSSWHGTHVSGTIAAETNNGVGVAGIAYGAKIVPARALGTGGGYTSDITDAMIWSAGGKVGRIPVNANPAQVINLSLGGDGPCSELEQDAIDTARSLGTTLVIAAGNDNGDAELQSPADCQGVVTVAATNRHGERAPYSNIGKIVDIAAPGGDTSNSMTGGILSTLNAGVKKPGADAYAFYQGTSMATPHVAGVAALMYGLNPALTPDEVECTLKATARPFPHPELCPNCGAGIVNAYQAVKAVKEGNIAEECGVTVVPTPIQLGKKVPLNGSRADQVRFTLADIPADRLVTVTVSGGQGDVDLFVSAGSAPTLGAADCGSFNIGNTESCVVPTTETGTTTIQIMAYGYTDFTNASLIVRTTKIKPLVPGTPLTLAGTAGSLQLLRYHSPQAGGTLHIDLTGGTGDADMLVLYRDPETGDTFQACFSDRDGTDEHCSFDLVANVTYDIEVYAFKTFANATLTAQYFAPVFIQSGVAVPVSGTEGSVTAYKLQVPEGSQALDVTLTGGTGDADLVVQYAAADGPHTLCTSFANGTAESCSLPEEGASLEPGVYTISVDGFTDFEGATLLATVSP